MTITAREQRQFLLSNSRRAEAQRVLRETRERLTSSTGTRPAFDHELLRLFAQNRLSASLVVVLLIAAFGLLSSLWSGLAVAGLWIAGLLAIHFVTIARARAFLAAPSGTAIKRWRLHFVALDLASGLGWMSLLIQPFGVTEGSAIFVLFAMLLVVAVSSMLASSLPIAALASTLPVTLAVAIHFAAQADVQGYSLAGLALAAQAYFLLLAHRLYSSALATLVARAEKDLLIGELEQAKAISDEARSRAEFANLSKSRFLAQMSHELRTPLNAILGFSEAMLSEIFGPHSVPAYKEYAGDIHSSGQHLLGLINEILDLSRIEAGRYELNEDTVSLTTVVEDCHHLMKLRAKNRNITIHENFEQNLPRVWADERALRQVCLNLLSNALKFTPQGGEIWIKVGWTAAGGQYFSVKDSGPGIPEEEIPVVLASFGQGSNALKTAEQGTGLGLPIAKNLIDLHGGTFNLKSKLRVGTEVIATLPPERVMAALAPLAEPAPPLQAPSPEAARAAPPAIQRSAAALIAGLRGK